MRPVVKQINPEQHDPDAVSEAARCLADGGLVVFPTETVYGIGARATDPGALTRLRQVKGREVDKPFTVHIGARAALQRFVPEVRGVAGRLVRKAWPGPLTLIFHVDAVEAAPVIAESSPEHASAMYHEGTIGIRCPDDPIAAGVLTGAGVPIVAASANRAGAPAPVTADEAVSALGEHVDLVLDTGRTRYGKPSTIVRVNGQGYRLVREGVLDERTIRRLSQVHFLFICSGNTCRSPMAVGLFRRLLAERLGIAEADLEQHGYILESAGISALAGAPPSPPGVDVLRKRGIDISKHRSQPLTLELAHRADYIFTMTGSHLDVLASMGAGMAEKTTQLGEADIPDPVGESEAVYEECAAQLERGLRRRLEEIRL